MCPGTLILKNCRKMSRRYIINEMLIHKIIKEADKSWKRKKCKDIEGCQNAGTAHISLWDSHSPYVPDRYTQWRSISAAQRAGRKRTGGRLKEKREKRNKEPTWWDLRVGSCSLACSTEEEREPQMDLERERDKGERNVAGELKVSSEFLRFSHVTSAATIHVPHQWPETHVWV